MFFNTFLILDFDKAIRLFQLSLQHQVVWYKEISYCSDKYYMKMHVHRGHTCKDACMACRFKSYSMGLFVANRILKFRDSLPNPHFSRS